MSRTPMALIWALIRAKRKKLKCCRSITSSDGDLLFASAVSDHIVTSWFSQSILWGVSKVMRHYVESGKAQFEEWSHLAMGMRLRAGAMGVPFMPIRPMLGSDVLKQRPEAKEFDCPFTGEKLLLVPALNPDVGIDSRATVRSLRQCANRWPPVHGHRSSFGSEQSHSVE